MKKRILLFFLLLILFVSGCQSKPADKPNRHSVYYQVFVGSFYDSDNDGIGDLNGVYEKLDYLQNDLGVSGIWLSPIHPSPTYHKYDVVDYYEIDEDYGTMDDFIRLSEELEKRDMDLMMDLVLNHTSNQHPWFKKAVSGVLNDECDTNQFCDYYNFSTDYESGYRDLNSEYYYEGQFTSEMPDLNLDNETVREEIQDITEFWMDQGVNAFRLDATTHFYENNKAKNIEFLGWFNDLVKDIDKDTYVVGEAWTNKSLIFDMATSGIDSFFNFSFGQNDGSIVKSINKGTGANLAQQVLSYHDELLSNNKNAVDALFLSNHDHGRSAGYFGSDLEKQKLAASIYLLMPGNSFVYYGEEIGMLGSGRDENKRLPMEWGESESDHIPKRFENTDYDEVDLVGVDKQLKDKDSILHHYQNVIQAKNRYPDLVEGDLELMDMGHDGLYGLAHHDLIVVHNLSNDDLEFKMDAKVLESFNNQHKNKKDEFTLSPYGSMILTRNQN